MISSKDYLLSVRLYLLGVAVLLAGCVTQFKIETVQDGIAQAHAELQAVYDTVYNLRASNVITPEQRDEILLQGERVEYHLRNARILVGEGDVRSADTQRRIAKTLLTQLIVTLEAQDE